MLANLILNAENAMAVALAMTTAIAIPDFLVSQHTFPPPCLIFTKLSWKISCNVIPTKQSRSHPEAEPVKEKRQPRPNAEQVKEKRLRRHNAMKRFLLKEAGLSSSQLAAVIRKDPSLFRRKSIEGVQDALKLFRDSGFTPEQVRKTILREPSVLTRRVDEQLKPKIELFKSLGLSPEDVAHVISRQPRILTVSLDNNLGPTSLLFVTLFGSMANVSKAIRRAPGLIVYDFETLKKKLKDIESIGFKQHEMMELLKKDPRFLCLSIDKIQRNINFLTHTAGFRPNIVVKYPTFLNFSIEKRMRPRYKVFEYLNALRPSKDLPLSLVTMFCISEQSFAERFLIGTPEVSKLYEKYKGKSGDVEIT